MLNKQEAKMMMKRKAILLLSSIFIVLSSQLMATPVFQTGHILLDTSGNKIAWASGGTGYNTGAWSEVSYSGDNWYVQWFENDGAKEIETSVTFLNYQNVNPSADAVIYYSDSSYSGSAPPTSEAAITQGSIKSWTDTSSSEVVGDQITGLSYAPEWVGIGIKGTDVQAYEMTSAVPEPATIALLGFGGFALVTRRKNK
jgi:hypothetical protein